MQSRKEVFRQTAIILIGQLILCGAMLGIYALLAQFTQKVLLGAIVGLLLATLNFFLMAVGVSLAADKAEKQNVKGGKSLLQMSMLGRYVLLAVVLFAFAKSGLCDVLPMALPLAFVRPILTVVEFFRRKGDGKS